MADHERWSRLTLEEVRRAADASADEEIGPAASGLSARAERMARELARPGLRPATLAALAAAVDAVALIGAFWAAQMVAPPEPEPLAALGRAAAGAAVAVGALGLFSGYRLRSLRGFAGAAAAAMAAAALGALVASALLGEGAAAPGLFGAMALAAALALGPWRLLAAAGARWALAAGVTERRAVIVGGGGNAERLIAGLAARADTDIRVVGMFDDRGDDRSPPLVAGVEKLGTASELVAFARMARIDMLIVTLPLSAEMRILSLLRRLWVLPVDVRLSAYSADYAFPRRAGVRGGDGEALIDVLRQPLDDAERLLKRGFDVAVAAAALLALSPLMLATALAIRLDSPGPVFFRQMRHGFNDRPVPVWKFRSMRHEQSDPKARRIVVRDDPRVTRVGRFIRRASIDELPQLFNVLAGDLSLVGPRPHALDAVSSRQQNFTEIVEGYSGRHRVPPGITGWAQVNGWRGEIDDPEKLRKRFEHDLYYIENWSFLFDLKILMLTPLRLFSGENAY